ncbi:hypothetical protein ACFE04_016479 [Oxalis oulophora]
MEEYRKLELRLGPPGETSHGYNHGAKRAFYNPQTEDSVHKLLLAEKKKPCPTPVIDKHSSHKSPATHTFHKRTTPTQVVGWPPIRSYRKNLSSNNSSLSKPDSDNSNKQQSNDETVKNPETATKKDLFVKVNMEGVAIGRKININAYDSYQKLSYAIDELFRSLLAAQSDSSSDENKMEEEKVCSIAGNGEYTLVYEDNEGDRILVGDDVCNDSEEATRAKELKAPNSPTTCWWLITSLVAAVIKDKTPPKTNV